MSFRVALSTLLAFLFVSCSSGGLYRWVPFAGHGKTGTIPAKIKPSKSGPFGPIAGPVYYGLEMRLKVSPEVIKLSDTHSLEARLQLINRRKKPVTLQFNDSRHYDFILRDASGKKLAQWSDDQPLNQTPGYVIINPNERAEFVGNISTRDMVAGRTYTLEALVAGYDNMRQTMTLAP
jgi:intracellular proteinase inhibitor BsuPI